MTNSDSQYFPASYDSTTKIISTIAFLLLAGIAIATMNVIVAIVGATIIFLSYAYSPRGYAISDGSIVVKRLLGSVRIPLDDIREVRRATPDDFRGGIRLFGDGGLFGYYGLFQTSKLGKSHWYMTNRANGVVVIGRDKTYVLSPDNPDEFVAAIRPRQAPGVQQVGSLPVSRSSSLSGLVPKLIVTVIVIAGLAFALFAFLYSPGPPSYTMTPASLAIHDRFYPATVSATDVDVSRIRVVDIGAGSEWRPVARTNGFANGHYQSGWFRVANGQTVRMYRTDSNVLVLLPPLGNAHAVLFETADPEKFVDEIRRAWSQRS